MGNPLLRLETFFLDLCFPRRCLGCGKEGAWVCGKCREEVVDRAEVRMEEVEGIGSVVSFFDFGEPLVRELLHNLKYNGIREVAAVMAGMVKELGREKDRVPANTILVPVPTSKAKLKARGYNQAEELAKELGKVMGVEVMGDMLVRRGKKKSQVGKGRGERQLQAEGAFVVHESGLKKVGHGLIIIFDDLYTTGSTVRACAEVLKREGMKVEVMTMAREG